MKAALVALVCAASCACCSAWNLANTLQASEFFRAYYENDDPMLERRGLELGTQRQRQPAVHGGRTSFWPWRAPQPMSANSVHECSPSHFRWTVTNIKGSGVPVDLVDEFLDEPYVLPFEDETFDLVTSANVLEHDEFPWVTIVEQCRVLKSGGLMFHITPSNGQYHTWPADRLRFYPGSAYSFAKWARMRGCDLHVVQSFLSDAKKSSWHMHVMVLHKGGKPASSHPKMEAKLPYGVPPKVCKKETTPNCEAPAAFDIETYDRHPKLSPLTIARHISKTEVDADDDADARFYDSNVDAGADQSQDADARWG